MRRVIPPLLILVLAAGLRFYGLGTQEIWLDEAWSWHTAQSSDVIRAVLPDVNPPLYSLVLSRWIGIFGDGRAALRSLSALEGTLLVAAVMWLASLLFDRRAALWSGFWAAVAVMHIYYSQEARAYAQLTLALTLAYACILKATESGRRTWWVGATLCAVAAAYTHYLALLALSFTPLLIVFHRPRPWRALSVIAGVTAAAILPWLLVAAAARPEGLSGTEWIDGIWAQTPPLMAIPLSLDLLILGAHAGLVPVVVKQLASIDFPVMLHLLGIAGLLILVGIALAPDENTRSPRGKWVVVALLLGPLVLLWCVSFVRPLYVTGRYDQIAMPVYPLLLGLACAKLQARSRIFCAGAVALVLVPVGWKLWLYYGAPEEPQARPVAMLLDSRAGDGDIVVFTELRALPVLYELSRLGYQLRGRRCVKGDTSVGFACRTYPRASEHTMATWYPHRTAGESEAIADAALDFAGDRGPGTGTVWIVLGSYARARGRLAATPGTADLLRQLERLGLNAAAAHPALGVLEYRQTSSRSHLGREREAR